MKLENHVTARATLISITFGVAATIGIGEGTCTAGVPRNPDFRIVRPSNSGIPGTSNMMLVDFGPDGRRWTHGRDFFWQQGGVAALGFETGRWKTWSSAETPLDQFCNDITFAADGSSWIVGDDVVARLHADGETFTAYTPGSTPPLVSGAYEAVAIAPNGHVWAANPGQVMLGGGLFELDGAGWTKHEEPWMVTWTGFGFAPPLNVFARSNGDVWATFQSSPGCMGRYRAGAWTQITTGPIILGMAETAESPSRFRARGRFGGI